MKSCPNCFKILPLSSFHKSKAKPDGHQRVCKPCNKEKVYGYRKEKVAMRWDAIMGHYIPVTSSDTALN